MIDKVTIEFGLVTISYILRKKAFNPSHISIDLEEMKISSKTQSTS
jgi:hypothetical protein